MTETKETHGSSARKRATRARVNAERVATRADRIPDRPAMKYPWRAPSRALDGVVMSARAACTAALEKAGEGAARKPTRAVGKQQEAHG